MQKKGDTEMQQPLFMTVANTARALDVSVWTIRRWCDSGILRSVRVGGRRLVEISSFPKTEEAA
jgi:excisionase family DNA binding protein